MNCEYKNVQKVVNGGNLHGITSPKRSDGFIISLWRYGKKTSKKRLRYPKFLKKRNFFPVSQRIAVRKTIGLLEVQNMSKRG